MSPSLGAFLASGAFLRNPWERPVFTLFTFLHLQPQEGSWLCATTVVLETNTIQLCLLAGAKQVLTPWNVLLLPLNLAEVNGPL